MQRLEDVDRELAGFGKDEEALRVALTAALERVRGLGDVDAALAALGASKPPSPVESLVPAGTSARPISWEEARRSSRPRSTERARESEELLGADALSDVPPVLAPDAASTAHAAAALEATTEAVAAQPVADEAVAAEPVADEAPDVEAASAEVEPAFAEPPASLALDPDPEFGDLSVEVPVVRPPTLPPPRPATIPPPNAEALLSEMLDQPDEDIAVRLTPEPEAPGVDEDEAKDALSALLAEDAQALAREDEFGDERTVMVRPESLRAPAVPGADDFADIEIDLDEEADVELAPIPPSPTSKSRPPPPPSRPPEAPAQSFLSRMLRGGKS
jgi:nicotinate-nucleotide--dimethylbenzimidazole phosphoribosyltransferase